MPFFQCTICKDNGSPVAKNVTVMLAETKPDDWYGTIRTAHLSDLAAGQLYVLKLEDERTGEVSGPQEYSRGRVRPSGRYPRYGDVGVGGVALIDHVVGVTGGIGQQYAPTHNQPDHGHAFL